MVLGEMDDYWKQVYERSVQISGKNKDLQQKLHAARESVTELEHQIEELKENSVFVPLMGLLCACGMLKGICAAARFGWLDPGGGAYAIWYNAGDAMFCFLPVLIAYTSAKKFKLNEFTGLLIGLVMCTPAIVASGSGEAVGSVLGYDTLQTPHFAASFAQTATVLAIGLKTKDKKLKGQCSACAISGIFGVTEPAIYGITLPRKLPFVISCIA